MSSEKITNYGATFKRSPIFYIISRLVILFFVIIIIFPLLYTLSLSIRSPDTIYNAKLENCNIISNPVFDNQKQNALLYLKKYTNLSDRKIMNRISNIFS